MSKLISISLIIKRNIKYKVSESFSNDEKVAESLLKVTHVRLDREGIESIDNLECLGPVTNLYLQQNLISKIQNLDCLSESLRFLTLSGNKIECVEGLLSLKVLSFLDLSDNRIDQLETAELPKSLIYVSFINNTCALHHSYRDELIHSLPNLKSIDGEAIHEVSDSESDLSEGDEDDCADSIQHTRTDMLVRALSRLDEVASEHKARLMAIEQTSNTTSIGTKSGSESVDESDLSSVQKRIRDILHVMVEAEHDAMNKFDVPVPLSTKVESNLPAEMPSDSVDGACDMGKKIKSENPNKGKNFSPVSPNKKKKPALVSVATTTSKMRTVRKTNTLAEKQVISPTPPNSLPKNNYGVDKYRRNVRKTSSESLVRIPGARPFHKT